ncbi:hypothetical protein B6D60_00190 [candidate division KSB1 bacterium 4484_87]|nr:MAG: hypothetical protein B6D60_00190 [candidate division KSB1 bacterium 4484_87]
MACTKKYEKWIWLSMYDELTADENKELMQHLQSCEQCRREWENAKQFETKLSEKEPLQVSEEILQQSRDALFHRIRMAERYGTKPLWLEKLRRIVTLDLRPQWRLMTALSMLIVGVFLGAKFFQQSPSLDSALLQDISFQAESIDRIENLSFDPQKNQVMVRFRTVQERDVQGRPDDPMIQRLLARTLVSDPRPNLRLRSVNALRETKSYSQQVLDALIEVLEKDDNSGVRLKAIKILNSIPWNEAVQPMLSRVFIKVLLQETNPAVRIEAVNALGKILSKDTINILNKAAEKDSNEYIRNKAAILLEKVKNAQF